MTHQDLRQFKAVQHKLDDHQPVQSLKIRTVGAPAPSETHGGPVFMSVGQVIQLDTVAETARRLEGESTEAAPVTVSNAEAQESPAAATTTTTEPAASESTVATPETATAESVAAEGTTTSAAASTPVTETPHISAGVNHGQDSAPIQSHSTKIGGPGDRFLFTESPVEYYYYHQPVVQKVQPKMGLTSGNTPIEISGAWFD